MRRIIQGSIFNFVRHPLRVHLGSLSHTGCPRGEVREGDWERGQLQRLKSFRNNPG